MLFALYYLTWLVYFHPITLFLTLQWHNYTRTYEVDVKSFKTAQTMQNILKFYCWKFEHTGNGKLWRLALRLFSYTNLESLGLSGRVDRPVYTCTCISWLKLIKRTFLGKFHNDKAMYSYSCLQPHYKVAMLGVQAVEFFLKEFTRLLWCQLQTSNLNNVNTP